MNRILTGIQSSGRPHLGNFLGSMKPAIQLSEKLKTQTLFFIADLHSLTTIKDGDLRRKNVESTAAAWLACDLDPSTCIIYRQSQITEVNELTLYLGYLTKLPTLINSHAFKAKSEKLADVNTGLFTYPILMAADMLLYNANFVPVGKDQKQHIEIARDIASQFNQVYGQTFDLPEPILNPEIMTIPGTDGQKTSKSYFNTIDIFSKEDILKNQVMSIKTGLETKFQRKTPQECVVFKLYSLISSPEEKSALSEKYEFGGYSYEEVKLDLFEKILMEYGKERENYFHFISQPRDLEERLVHGESEARKIAHQTIKAVREKLGFD